MRSLFQWLTALATTAVAVAIAYLWLDRPIALMVHEHVQSAHHGIFDELTHIPDPLIPLAAVGFIGLGLRALLGRSLSNHQAFAFICSLSVLCTETIKNLLKFIFGRTWPETWAHSNPSFIRDHVYGFHFMHGGGGYESFPSGHMAATCAAISVVWFWYPRLRWLCALAGLAVGVGLVGANYHFLSDVMAGAFLGISIGWMATAIWTSFRSSSVRNVK